MWTISGLLDILLCVLHSVLFWLRAEELRVLGTRNGLVARGRGLISVWMALGCTCLDWMVHGGVSNDLLLLIRNCMKDKLFGEFQSYERNRHSTIHPSPPL